MSHWIGFRFVIFLLLVLLLLIVKAEEFNTTDSGEESIAKDDAIDPEEAEKAEDDDDYQDQRNTTEKVQSEDPGTTENGTANSFDSKEEFNGEAVDNKAEVTEEDKEDKETEDTGGDETDEDDYEEDDEESTPIDDRCPGERLMTDLKPSDYDHNLTLNRSKNVGSVNETMQLLNRLQDVVIDINNKLWLELKRSYGSFYDQILTYDSIAPECVGASLKIILAVQRGQLWALKLLDSIGSPKAFGRLLGWGSSLGHYRECLNAKSPTDGVEAPVTGQYCLVKTVLPFSDAKGDHSLSRYLAKERNPKAFGTQIAVDLLNYFNGTVNLFGLCLARQCPPGDIERIINDYLFPFARVLVEVGPDCYTKDQPWVIDGYQIFAIVTIAILLTFVLTSTIVDLIDERSSKGYSPTKKSPTGWIKCFSAVTSHNLLLFNSSSGPLGHLDGIIFFATVNALLLPYYVLFILHPSTSGFLDEDGVAMQFLAGNWKYLMVKNFNIIDIHFAVCGLLMAHFLFDFLLKDQHKFDYDYYLMILYLRVAPPVLGSIIFIYLLPLTGEGPFWQSFSIVKWLVEPCKGQAYKTLLFVTNYSSLLFGSRTCNTVGMLFSAGFQLLSVAPLLILAMHRWPKWALPLNIFIMILGFLSPLIPHLMGIRGLVNIFSGESLAEFDRSIVHHYFSTYSHLGPFAAGILVVHLAKTRPKLSLGIPFGDLIILGLGFLSAATSLIWLSDYLKIDINIDNLMVDYGDILHQTPDRWNSLLYVACNKFLWTFGFCCLSFLCITERAPAINWLLSHRVFLPWSRLMVGVYLNHLAVLARRLSAVDDNFHLTDDKILQAFCFDFALNMLISYFQFLLFEAPPMNFVLAKICQQSIENNSNKAEENNNRTEDATKNCEVKIFTGQFNVKPTDANRPSDVRLTGFGNIFVIE